MKSISTKSHAINWVLLCTLAFSIFTGCATTNDVTSQARTQLGTIPAFHSELGFGALQGYLNAESLPNSIDLIPPPPTPDSAAFAHDEEVARSTFALRDTPRFAMAVADYDLKFHIWLILFPAH
jgi:acid phosphatase (class A)